MSWKFLGIVVLWMLPLTSFSQGFKVNLSAQHKMKLSMMKSGHRSMVKYYKMYKKDSVQYAKKLDKKYQASFDSAWQVQRKQARLERRLIKKGIPLPKPPSITDSLQREIQKHCEILKDSTLSDSVRVLATEQLQSLVYNRARQFPGFQHYEERYKMYGDTINWSELAKQVPGIDTVNGLLKMTPSEFFNQSEKIVSKNAERIGGYAGQLNSNLSKLDEFKGMENQLPANPIPSQNEITGDTKEKISDKAMDYFEKNPDKLERAQQKASKLLSKYRMFSNSNDLNDAKKKTSMEGKTLWERLLVGGSINIVSVKPVSLDFSLQLGYKFTARWSVGAGMNYRHTFGDSIKNNWYVSPRNAAWKLFSNYDIINKFFACVEWERAAPTSNKEDYHNKTRVNNYLIGVGRKFLVHPKVYLTVTALYNLNSQDENPVYARKFQVRIGFQLSELAARKKKIYYNPNR